MKTLHQRLQDRSIAGKESAQLNKYLAGLTDSDGCIRVRFQECVGGYRLRVNYSLGLIDHSLVEDLQHAYQYGSCHKRDDMMVWEIGRCIDALKLIQRMNRYLLIKGTYALYVRDLYYDVCDKGSRVLTQEEVKQIKASIEAMRDTSKWIKHPKHPPWAWLAGFLDGDGSYYYRCRKRYHATRECYYFNNILRISCLQDRKYEHVLRLLESAIGGRISYRKKDNNPTWEVSLGKKNRSLALRVLPKLKKFSCIPRKREKINLMLKFHSECHPQRTSGRVHSK